MGIDWEEILGVEGDEIADAYESIVCDAMALENHDLDYEMIEIQSVMIDVDGKSVKINGTWSGHEFTQDELDKLAAGEVIEFKYQDRYGEDRIAKGKLLKKIKNGETHWGFYPSFSKEFLEDQCFSGEFNGRNVLLKKVWGGHTFTKDEVEKLFAGDTIEIEYTTKAGDHRKTMGSLQEYPDSSKGYIRFVPDFNK